MISARRWICVLLIAGFCGALGCGDGSTLNPEQTARTLFELEWANNTDGAWELFHPIWQKHMHQDNFAKYANDTEDKNAVWAENPRSITRAKTFSGSQIPGGAQGLAVALGREKYDFSVVRIAVDYPKIEGYYGGVVEYLITLAKKKEKGAQWMIISKLDEVGVTEFFNW
jgi:hypothetical protein